MLPIPPGTYFSYNGFTFPVACTTKVTETPVTSADNRVVAKSKIHIAVTGWLSQDDADAFAAANNLAAGLPLDALMQYLRKTLGKHQQNLVYKSRGYGLDLNINPFNNGNVALGPGIRDVAMGPKAGKLVWWNLGGAPDSSHGAGFEWEISTHIAECKNFNIAPGVFTEVSYSVDYSTDTAGLVTITYRGSAQIPMSLNPANQMDFTIDDQLGKIINPTPTGFIRSMSRQISPDRTSVNFSIMDKQQEVPPPPHVIEIEMRQRVRQDKPQTPIWTVTLSGSLRMSPAANPYYAWVRFFNIAAQRMAYARAMIANMAIGLNGENRPVQGNGAVARPPGLIPQITEFDENLFKNEARFSISFKLVGAMLDDIVTISGLWQPIVNNANYLPPRGRTWTAQETNTSLADNAQWWSGLLGTKFDKTTDIILDVCAGPIGGPSPRSSGSVGGSPSSAPPSGTFSPNPVLGPVGGSPSSAPPSGTFGVGVGDGAGVGVAGGNMATTALTDSPSLADLPDETYDPTNGMFPPTGSWVEWECDVQRFVDYRQIRHKPLSGDCSMLAPANDPFGPVTPIMSDTSVPSQTWTATTPDLFQQAASPSLTIVLTGHSVRIGSRYAGPRAIAIGGLPAILKHEWVAEKTIGIGASQRMYRTDWQLVYMMGGPPAAIPLPANPMLGTNGEGGASELVLQSPILGG